MKESIEHRIKDIQDRLESYIELRDNLQEMDMIFENTDWVDCETPHHFNIEIPRVMAEVENKIEVIERKLRMI